VVVTFRKSQTRAQCEDESATFPKNNISGSKPVLFLLLARDPLESSLISGCSAASNSHVLISDIGKKFERNGILPGVSYSKEKSFDLNNRV